jgi:LuxR family maltose regulon positive regulatory protein
MQNSQNITNRESTIMLMLKKGFSNQKISQETGISVNTVKYHLKRIYKKLQAQNRVEAINKFNSINLKTYSK